MRQYSILVNLSVLSKTYKIPDLPESWYFDGDDWCIKSTEPPKYNSTDFYNGNKENADKTFNLLYDFYMTIDDVDHFEISLSDDNYITQKRFEGK